jgi:large subunit ribosomal protein L24
MKIKKDDNVLVIAGKDKGKKGKVRFVYPKEHKAMIEGVNMIKTHSKAKAQVKQAGLIEREASIDLSNVMLLCNHCNHPVRIGYKSLDNGKKARTCRACGEVIE